MRLERPGVSPASVRHGSWRAAILVCLLAGRGTMRPWATCEWTWPRTRSWPSRPA